MPTAGLRLLEQWHQAKPPVKAPSNISEPSYNVSINGSCIGMQFSLNPRDVWLEAQALPTAAQPAKVSSAKGPVKVELGSPIALSLSSLQ
jgi:hypothetical protein